MFRQDYRLGRCVISSRAIVAITSVRERLVNGQQLLKPGFSPGELLAGFKFRWLLLLIFHCHHHLSVLLLMPPQMVDRSAFSHSSGNCPRNALETSLPSIRAGKQTQSALRLDLHFHHTMPRKCLAF